MSTNTELCNIIEKQLENCLPGQTDPDDAMYRVGYRDAMNFVLNKLHNQQNLDNTESSKHNTFVNNIIIDEGYLGKVKV